MQITKLKELSQKQFLQIEKLWNEEYPITLKDRFPILLEGVEKYDHYIIEDAQKSILAWAVTFEKDSETRFSLIVRAEDMGRGLGSLLIQTLKAEVEEFYGWVIDHDKDVKSNGEKYRTPIPFYIKQGFEILAGERIETAMLSATKIKWSSLT